MQASRYAMLLILALGAGSTPAVATTYQVVARWAIGGEGGWDYLTADPEARRLYVSHAGEVVVLDLDRGTVLGRITPTPGVHGVALAPALGRGFISCGRDSSVVVFDLKSNAVLARVALPARNPDAILFEPATGRVFTFHGGSGSASVLDGATAEPAGTITLHGRPEFAVADGRGQVFANLEDSSQVVQIDARSLAIVNRWSLAPGQEPSGLAIDAAHRRLFSVCGNRTMVVLDADKGTVLASLPIGSGVDGVAFDPQRSVAIATNGEGTISVVREESPSHFELAGTDSTKRGARTLAIDPKSGRVFTATADFGPPPAPTADRPHPRPGIVPGTFQVLVLAPRETPAAAK